MEEERKLFSIALESRVDRIISLIYQ